MALLFQSICIIRKNVQFNISSITLSLLSLYIFGKFPSVYVSFGISFSVCLCIKKKNSMNMCLIAISIPFVWYLEKNVQVNTWLCDFNSVCVFEKNYKWTCAPCKCYFLYLYNRESLHVNTCDFDSVCLCILKNVKVNMWPVWCWFCMNVHLWKCTSEPLYYLCDTCVFLILKVSVFKQNTCEHVSCSIFLISVFVVW